MQKQILRHVLSDCFWSLPVSLPSVLCIDTPSFLQVPLHFLNVTLGTQSVYQCTFVPIYIPLYVTTLSNSQKRWTIYMDYISLVPKYETVASDFHVSYNCKIWRQIQLPGDTVFTNQKLKFATDIYNRFDFDGLGHVVWYL